MNTGRKKLLIIDNEETLTEMLKIALEQVGGFHVQTENNPISAVGAARQFQPDLIVLDIKMPGLDGADVIMRIRNEPKLAQIPVVFFTGNVSANESRMIGNCRFLAKTVRLDEMVACLKQALADADEQSTTQPKVA